MTQSTGAFGTFFLPGPTEVRPEILAAMMRPMIPHRGREFEVLFARLQERLRPVFRTSSAVYISSSSATGLMETSLRCATPGAVLALVNGAFSERYARIAAACGHETETITVPAGETFDSAEIEERMRRRTAHRDRYMSVTVVHSETSTGVLSDVAAICDAVHRNGAMCLVDGVTSVAGTTVEHDAWELDFTLTGSQKALALPPGLALGVASERFVALAGEARNRGVYLDVREFHDFAAKNQTPNTPALPLLYALDAQLEAIAAEGIEARWARHRAMAERTWRWVDETRESMGIDIGVLAPEGYRSPTVTAVTLPAEISGKAVVAAVAQRGYVIGGGYGKLAESSFRIGHMGDHTVTTLDGCLAAISESLEELRG